MFKYLFSLNLRRVFKPRMILMVDVYVLGGEDFLGNTLNIYANISQLASIED